MINGVGDKLTKTLPRAGGYVRLQFPTEMIISKIVVES